MANVTEVSIETSKLSEFSQNRINYKTYEDDKIPKISATELSYLDFLKSFMITNKPCIVRPTADSQNQIAKWEINKWVTDDGTPKWNTIVEQFGQAIVPVADCSVKEYNSQRKEYVLLSQYIKYCQKLIEENYDYSKMPCLYLKDWHLRRTHPDFNAYKTPEYFESDWLNSFYISQMDLQDDYRFVYIGPKGTWTPFHTDVFGSYSWSANVCGRKRWLLFPPGAEKFFLDINGKLVFDIQSPDLQDLCKYPKAQEYFEKYGKGIEVIQEAGEIIFVPSGWHHQVWNLEDTISVNHNWFNGCNIDLIWRNMCFALKEVKDELEDCKTDDHWNVTCQLVLHAHHGMNFAEFLSLLDFMVNDCKEILVQSKCSKRIFDLECILYMTKLLQENHSEELGDLNILVRVIEMEDSINSFLLENGITIT